MKLPDRARASLPWTAYLWAAILILSFAVKSGKPAEQSAAPAMTGTRFAEVQSAEQQARAGFGLESLTGGRTPQTSQSLEKARAGFRKLARDGKSPGSSRKAILLAAALQKPLETALLTNLESALTSTLKLSPKEATQERTLWNALYSPPKAAPPLPPESEKRVKEMGLGFLENLALADLYAKEGKKPAADAARERLRKAATRSTTILFLFGAAGGLAGTVGVVLLVLFLTAAITKRWELVGRVATRPIRLPAGELLDGFLFYLALYMGAGAALSPLAGDLPTNLRLPMVVGLQLASGLGGIAYLAAKAKKRDLTLIDLGLTGRDLGVNALYGVLGWCAGLPIMFVAGLLAQKLFHGSGATPNPILPLLASDRAPLDRALIFLLAGVGAPLFEEFFFRGALFGSFRANLRWGAAAALSALVFAMVHPMQDWLPIFALGLAFGTIRELRQSLVPGIVAHCLQNSFAFLMLTSVFG